MNHALPVKLISTRSIIIINWSLFSLFDDADALRASENVEMSRSCMDILVNVMLFPATLQIVIKAQVITAAAIDVNLIASTMGSRSSHCLHKLRSKTGVASDTSAQNF